MRKARENAGFVLVMVLLVLLIAGTILAGAARRSCEGALEASRAERELQVRWGAQSCQDHFLRQSERFLREAEADRRGGLASVRRTVVLGGMPFHVTVSDEEAKANVNTLLARKGGIGLEVSLRNLQRDLSKALLVRPGVSSSSGLASLEGVFLVEHPSEFFDAGGRSRLLDRVTCWGSGKVNFKRADACVLREMLDGALSETEIVDLMKFRQRAPDCSLAEALGELKLPKERIEQVMTLMTDTSRCHGVWVVAEGRTRSWHRFYVADGPKVERKSPRRVFLW